MAERGHGMDAEIEMKAILVCVGYDDLLGLTLPQNVRHFEEMLVVTSSTDHATVLLANSFDSVYTHQTDAFYRRGAEFNKGLAMEEGFEVLGRRGVIAVLDADVVLPPVLDFSGWKPGCLGSAYRRMCHNPAEYHGQEDWSKFLLRKQLEHAGYLQLFSADDPVLQNIRSWYGTDWRHCGGCDSDFQKRWPNDKKVWMPFEVLHLGLEGVNWWGRTTPRLDGTPLPDNRNASRNMREMYRQRRCTKCYDWEKIHPICSTQ